MLEIYVACKSGLYRALHGKTYKDLGDYIVTIAAKELTSGSGRARSVAPGSVKIFTHKVSHPPVGSDLAITIVGESREDADAILRQIGAHIKNEFPEIGRVSSRYLTSSMSSWVVS